MRNLPYLNRLPSHRPLAEITGVPKSRIVRVIPQQEKLREEWTLRHGQQGTSQKRKCGGKDLDVEEDLNKWLFIATGRGVRVRGQTWKI
jgi:hypothetical protein